MNKDSSWLSAFPGVILRFLLGMASQVLLLWCLLRLLLLLSLLSLLLVVVVELERVEALASLVHFSLTILGLLDSLALVSWLATSFEGVLLGSLSSGLKMFSMAFIGLVMSPVDSMGLVSLVWIGSSLVPCLLRQIACDSSIDSTLNFFNTSKPFFRCFTTGFHQCLPLPVS